MKIMEFIFIKTQRLFVLCLMVLLFLGAVNYLTNNLIIVGLGKIDEKVSVMTNPCDDELSIKNGVLILKDFVFEEGLGNCVQKLEPSKINKVVIDDVYGGDVTETRILGEFIQEHKLPVYIAGRCESSCLDLVLHSPQRFICYDGRIGIHSYALGEDESNFFQFLVPLKQNAMLRAFDNTNINVNYIKNIMSSTDADSIHYPKNSELKRNYIVHREIPCNKDFVAQLIKDNK